jgi:4-amino-4-deoxy-L-arabinose transferase-like glycosyltransferase
LRRLPLPPYYRRIGQRAPFFSPLSNRALAWLAVVIVFVALCYRLGHLPLLAPDEGRNAEVGREMKESGAWLVPTYDGVDYLDKPAFYFKAVAVSLALIGRNETAARAPSAAFGIALVILAFAFCRKVHGAACGWLAAIIIATTPLFVINARTVIFDIALAFFVSAAIFAGYLAEETDGRARRNWYLASAAAAGFATLVKGPVGFLVPLLVLLIFNRVEKRRGAWRRLLAPLNLLVFFGVTLPWFVGLCLAHRDFLHYGLVEESFHRFVSPKAFHRSRPVYFYLLVVAGTFFPWSLLLPEASLATWKQRWANNRADRLCLVWAVVVVVFFSVSQSKLPAYILSAAVACGILVARIFQTAFLVPESSTRPLIGRATAAFAAVCLVVAIAVIAGASQMARLAGPMDIPVPEAARLGQSLTPVAILLIVFGASAWLAWRRRNPASCFLALALFPPLFAIVGLGPLEVIFDAKSSRRLAAQLAALPAGTELACLECFPNGLPFYLARTATLISLDGGELTSNYIKYSLTNDPQHISQIVLLNNFETWLASRKTPVYLIAREYDRDRLQTIASARRANIQPLAPPYLGAQLPAPGGQ